MIYEYKGDYKDHSSISGGKSISIFAKIMCLFINTFKKIMFIIEKKEQLKIINNKWMRGKLVNIPTFPLDDLVFTDNFIVFVFTHKK